MDSLENDFKTFMETNFLGLELCSPLFYNWETSIRFELEEPEKVVWGKFGSERVYNRSESLFDALFQSQDEMYVVMNIYRDVTKNKGFLPSVVNNKKLLNKVTSFNLKNPYLDDEDEDKTISRIILKCQKKDLRKSIVKKYFNSNLADLFFVNIKNETIFYIYDSRGCDLVSENKESIKSVYEKFNNWILDYDRKRIDETFKFK
jgi:hypothetical protein